MTDSTPRPPAGWYPAPHANGETRYWDGEKWIELAPPPPDAAPADAPTSGPVPAEAGAAAATVEAPVKKKRRMRWWGWTLVGVGAFVLLIIIIASVNGSPSKAPADTAATSPAAKASTSAEKTTPTPQAPPAPKVAHQQFTGSSDMVQAVNITSPAIVTFECDECQGNTVLETNGSEALLVNEIGAYKGQHIINVYDGDVTSQFTITADAPWVLTVDDLTTAPKVTGAASGHGDSVIMMNSHFSSAAITNNGASNFVVQAYGNTDNATPLIVNKIGAYSGTVPMAGPAYVQVESSGDWTITPQ